MNQSVLDLLKCMIYRFCLTLHPNSNHNYRIFVAVAFNGWYQPNEFFSAGLQNYGIWFVLLIRHKCVGWSQFQVDGALHYICLILKIIKKTPLGHSQVLVTPWCHAVRFSIAQGESLYYSTFVYNIVSKIEHTVTIKCICQEKLNMYINGLYKVIKNDNTFPYNLMYYYHQLYGMLYII